MNRSKSKSSFNTLTSGCETGSAAWIEACWNDMHDRARSGDAYDAEQYISMIPNASARQIADLVYGEFVASRDRGKAVSAEQYLAKYPDIAEQLARQFTIDEALSEINDGEPLTELDSQETLVTNSSFVTDRYKPSAEHRSKPSEEERIGRYVIVDKLNKGAQAEVYRAFDPTLKRDVLVKIETKRVPNQQRLFSDVEAIITANLNHPNIAPALDAGDHRGRKYSVSRFIRGRTFDQWKHDRNPSPQLVAQTIAKVARGLAHAHKNAVLHLDVKPKNIVVDESQEPYLIDFGLSVLCDAYTEQQLDEGSVRGTLRFMAPEQLKGDVNRIGPCSDIFGLGATLFMGWVGRAPYDTPLNRNDLSSIERCEWNSEWLDEAALSDDMKSIVRRALAASPDERFTNCDSFAAELERVSKTARHETVTGSEPLTFFKNGMLWMRVLLGAAALVLVFGFAKWLRTDSTEDNRSGLSVSHPTIKIVVATDDSRSVDLANRVPLIAGDKLQLSGVIPANRAALVVAFSPNGDSQVIARYEKQDKAHPYQHPSAHGKGIPLVGSGGTEVIALMTARSEDALDRVMTQIEWRPTPWALIPELSVLVWSNDEFASLQPTSAEVASLDRRLAGNSRSLGAAVDIDPALTNLSDQIRKLTAVLNLEGIDIDAVAFRHLDIKPGR